ncbi:molybdopterin molybdotransferase MoeA [Leucobacter sp. USHLN153]|uniref:molybdopterin molybdotransferase MoeA n=1 Tax=Leucobacter sp. USHLN153 TaxID=3081268 RepID=UPI003018CCDA
MSGEAGSAAGRAGTTAISAEEHLAWILERIGSLAERELPLSEASGLVLARDAAALCDLPLWANSAMDGYALRAGDVRGADASRPVPLRVVGEVAAGSAENPAIGAGEAVRIMTGAPLPSDADAVIPVERTRGDADGDPWARAEVVVLAEIAAGANVRRRGEDTRAGDVLARAGETLSAARAAALAAAGVSRVAIRPRPRMAVLVTGSELRGPGEPLQRGQIPESNSTLIAGLLRENGVSADVLPVSRDDAAALHVQLGELSETYDVIVTTGGVGPGRHDIVRIAVADEPDVRAVRVAVRPGQPQCTGRLRGGAWIFALPGNPVSAAVSFELFVRPALRQLQGCREVERLRLPAVAAEGWRGAAGRLQVLPVRVVRGAAGLECRPAVDPRGVSHAVGSHGSSDGYALVGADRGDVAAGDIVDVVLVAS